MKTLPPQSQRSLTRPKRDPAKRGVNPPRIFVEVKRDTYSGKGFAEARIRVRCGCYRYLVWRDSGRKREFYLGKLSNLTPRRSSSSSPAPATSRGVKDGR